MASVIVVFAESYEVITQLQKKLDFSSNAFSTMDRLQRYFPTYRFVRVICHFKYIYILDIAQFTFGCNNDMKAYKVLSIRNALNQRYYHKAGKFGGTNVWQIWRVSGVLPN